jgi:curved DNA-binding protein CbpA
MAIDDYYELLDVAPDSDRENIRVAYRAKRDALQAQDGARTRAQIAELNRAWNVLSDPIQRERYDERLAEHRESGDDDGDEDDYEADDDDERPVPVTRAQHRAEARRKRGVAQPTIVLPDGLTMAPIRRRLQALSFDLLVLFALLLVAYFTGLKLIDNHFPGERKRGDDLVTQQTNATKTLNNDKKKVSAADKAIAAAKLKKNTAAEAKATAQAAAARAAQAKDTKAKDVITAKVDKINKQLSPWIELTFLTAMALMLLYLVPSTAISGQTLGKRIWKIRVVKRLDGSRPGLSTAFVRFGLPLLLGIVLALPLHFQLLGFAIPVLGMIGWINKPNRQGLHDRLAKTIVVEA